jgi:hypothetical protein
MVGNKSKLYTEHPDWILHKTDGSPIINMAFYGEGRLWGAMDEEIYTLDTSNPEAMEYLRKVFRVFKEMGISFFKTDFMLYGSEPTNKVKRFTPGKTAIEYQHDLFNMIRQEIGKESFWLGCIAPYVPMIGYVDGMRISADISPSWEGGKNMFDETIGCQHINNIWWQNDPDAMILREKYNRMDYSEAKSMILWIGMLGGMINTSDLFHDIPKERLDLFRFIEPSKTPNSSLIPFIDKNEKVEVIIRKYQTLNSFAILFVNRSNEAFVGEYELSRMINIDKANAFLWDVKSTEKLGVIGKLKLNLKPHESTLFYISVDGKSPGNMTLGGE